MKPPQIRLPDFRLPPFLNNLPRAVILLAVPLVAFLIAVGFSLGASGGGDKSSTPLATVAVALSQFQSPTPQPAQPTPTATAVAIRNDCAAIRGTDYRSPDERDWFQKNCSGGGSTAAASTGGAGSSGGTYTAPAASTRGQSFIGDRLVVSAAGVNAPVWSAYVDNGYMPDPQGYDNVVWYDFSSSPGYGGYVDKGNMVISGHVDCGRCRNGGSGTAVFWSVRSLKVGDTAQYYTRDGRVQNYVVSTSNVVSADSAFAGIVASGAADMTFITCTGTFAGGEYDQRHYVLLRKA